MKKSCFFLLVLGLFYNIICQTVGQQILRIPKNHHHCSRHNSDTFNVTKAVARKSILMQTTRAKAVIYSIR